MTWFQIAACVVSATAVAAYIFDSIRKPGAWPVRIPPAILPPIITMPVPMDIEIPTRLSLQESLILVIRIREDYKDPDVTSYCNQLIKSLLEIPT